MDGGGGMETSIGCHVAIRRAFQFAIRRRQRHRRPGTGWRCHGDSIGLHLNNRHWRLGFFLISRFFSCLHCRAWCFFNRFVCSNASRGGPTFFLFAHLCHDNSRLRGRTDRVTLFFDSPSFGIRLKVSRQLGSGGKEFACRFARSHSTDQ